ncbi:SDR family oxidoreductase [Sphingobacterium sp. Mn56C]|uniref:SDR family oxidoreductase n=1 Tax=Sphingobacterium sp. Mn56C TaxID=3395261 RepID=UPI003BC0BE69
MLLITGATGHLGSSVVQQLLKRTSTRDFVVTSSNQQGVSKLASQGLQARIANFSSIESLHAGFQGIDKLVLISTMNTDRFEQHKNVIDAAKAQGVKHIIYTSLAIHDIQTSGVKDLMISHFQTEDYIKESGLTYSILRNTMYADALTQILGPNVLEIGIKLPGGNGKVPYVLRREMGEATANLLFQKGHDNKTYNFTGSKSVGFKEIAATLSALTSKKLNYTDISTDVFIKSLQEMGLPDFAVYLHAGTLHDIKTQQYAVESDALEKLLGRPTASLEEFLKELFTI